MTIAVDMRPMQEGIGGIAEYTKNLVLHLIASHPQHHYVLFFNSFSPLTISPLFRRDNTTIAQFHLPNKVLNASFLASSGITLDGMVRSRTKRSIDVCFSPNLNFLRFGNTVPSVITVHDLSFHHFPQFLSGKQYLWHRLVKPKKLLSSSTKLIAVSQHTKQDLINTFHIPAEQISVVPLGVSPLAHSSSCKWKPTHGSNPYILALAANGERKNIGTVVSAFARAQHMGGMNTISLVVSGGNSPEYQRLKKMVQVEKIPRVHFVGSIADENRFEWFSHASLFVYPSVYEGFGLPPIEAMAHGVPVVASANSSMFEVVNNAGMLVDSYNVSAWANALKKMTSDARLRTHYIQRGHAVSSAYTWNRTAKETMHVFDSLAASC